MVSCWGHAGTEGTGDSRGENKVVLGASGVQERSSVTPETTALKIVDIFNVQEPVLAPLVQYSQVFIQEITLESEIRHDEIKFHVNQ